MTTEPGALSAEQLGEKLLQKYGVDCGVSIEKYGDKLIYGQEFMRAFAEGTADLRQRLEAPAPTPELPRLELPTDNGTQPECRRDWRPMGQNWNAEVTPEPGALSAEPIDEKSNDPEYLKRQLRATGTYIRDLRQRLEAAQQDAEDKASLARIQTANFEDAEQRLEASDHAFANFHRSLCERFGYTHDPVDWQRDQVSLEEHIAKRLEAAGHYADDQIAVLVAEYGFDPASEPDESWGDAKQRGYGRYMMALAIKERMEK